jgi:hypothetical protein
MFRPLTRKEVEEMHDQLRDAFAVATKQFKDAKLWGSDEAKARTANAVGSVAQALIVADRRAKELNEEEVDKAKPPVRLPGQAL